MPHETTTMIGEQNLMFTHIDTPGAPLLAKFSVGQKRGTTTTRYDASHQLHKNNYLLSSSSLLCIMGGTVNFPLNIFLLFLSGRHFRWIPGFVWGF